MSLMLSMARRFDVVRIEIVAMNALSLKRSGRQTEGP
jgi:hypothetical protein